MKCLFLCCLVLLGCGGDPISPETDVLSNFMSIANVRRDPVHNVAGDIIGIDLSAEIINTGPVPIISPVIMTWKLRGPNSEEIARATHRFAKFDAGQAQGIALTMTFAPRENLLGVQDVVTFDFEESSQ